MRVGGREAAVAAWGRAGLAPPEVRIIMMMVVMITIMMVMMKIIMTKTVTIIVQVVTTLLGEWSQLLGSGRRLEEVCMWTTAVVDRS